MVPCSDGADVRFQVADSRCRVCGARKVPTRVGASCWSEWESSVSCLNPCRVFGHRGYRSSDFFWMFLLAVKGPIVMIACIRSPSPQHLCPVEFIGEQMCWSRDFILFKCIFPLLDLFFNYMIPMDNASRCYECILDLFPTCVITVHLWVENCSSLQPWICFHQRDSTSGDPEVQIERK